MYIVIRTERLEYLIQFGMTPLHYAADLNRHEVVRLLVRHRAAVDDVDKVSHVNAANRRHTH